jgi:beta-hydroxylase
VFYDSSQFGFAAPLQQNWRAIYQEFLGVRHRMFDWFEKELYGEGWKVVGLYDFPHGKPIADNVGDCPLTAALVSRHFPRHGAAGFSVLLPGTHIKPHDGYQGEFLRCHLGLSVPPGDCGLTVGGATRRWENGALLVFDDRVRHEAWNRTAAERVVLLVDFVPERPL